MVTKESYNPNELIIVRSDQKTEQFARLAQSIGYAAWTNRFPNRPDVQIRNAFNPDSDENAYELMDRMHSKIGQFVCNLAILDGRTIGYAWAADDVGNISPFQQKLKTFGGELLKNEKPYAWLAQINVLPEYQGNGVGTVLLNRTLEPFAKDQRVSAYSIMENQSAIRWFENHGFSPRPAEPKDPADDVNGPDKYFGEGAEHVMQLRLQADSVKSVITTLHPDVLPLHRVIGLAV